LTVTRLSPAFGGTALPLRLTTSWLSELRSPAAFDPVASSSTSVLEAPGLTFPGANSFGGFTQRYGELGPTPSKSGRTSWPVTRSVVRHTSA
jgi:hypothetical protein